MRKIFQPLIVLCFLIATATVGHSEECAILTPADVQTITGTQVQNVPFGSKIGAGGNCANFATSDGKLYLGVSKFPSVDYNKATAAVPESIYPKREKLTNVGDEAVLMKDRTGKLRYLVAYKGKQGVILFPFYARKQSLSGLATSSSRNLPLSRCRAEFKQGSFSSFNFF